VGRTVVLAPKPGTSDEKDNSLASWLCKAILDLPYIQNGVSVVIFIVYIQILMSPFPIIYTEM